ncbi:hypothetical protein N7475_010072, partial [Penicillium sp. IBT 31633x]
LIKLSDQKSLIFIYVIPLSLAPVWAYSVGALAQSPKGRTPSLITTPQSMINNKMHAIRPNMNRADMAHTFRRIYERRADGEVIPQGHPDLHDRAHTFHHPRQHHEYSDPFVKIPKSYSRQMVAEHNEYHVIGDDRQNTTRKKIVTAAVSLSIGAKVEVNEHHGSFIYNAIGPAVEGRGRSGFVHKYPQAYEDEKAMKSHEKEINDRRIQANRYRRWENTLHENHAKWSARMIAQNQQ